MNLILSLQTGIVFLKTLEKSSEMEFLEMKSVNQMAKSLVFKMKPFTQNMEGFIRIIWFFFEIHVFLCKFGIGKMQSEITLKACRIFKNQF